MDAIQGAGGTSYRIRPVEHKTGGPSKEDRDFDENVPGDTTCMGAALRLSRNYLSLALQDSGFVDICAGAAGGVRARGHFDLPLGMTEPDVRGAGEIAASFGQQVAGNSVERILELVLPPDRKYVLTLLQSQGNAT